MTDGWGISCKIVLWWMPLDLSDNKSTLVQVMAWCRQATSHYLSQCWLRSLSPYGVTRPQHTTKVHHLMGATFHSSKATYIHFPPVFSCHWKFQGWQQCCNLCTCLNSFHPRTYPIAMPTHSFLQNRCLHSLHGKKNNIMDYHSYK